MHRLALFLALMAAAFVAFTAPLYKWVDEQGVVHYSDKPVPGATKMQLPAAQTYKAPAASAYPPPAQPEEKKRAQPYDSFIIASPGQDESLWNVTSITVTVSLTPGLQNGDRVTISLDGKSKGPSPNLSATFDNLERGEHVVTATVQTLSGQTQSAPPVKFSIHLPSVHHTI